MEQGKLSVKQKLGFGIFDWKAWSIPRRSAPWRFIRGKNLLARGIAVVIKVLNLSQIHYENNKPGTLPRACC
jgi:hypothetical protein